jgi:outer membrane protein assembly factor BamB
MTRREQYTLAFRCAVVSGLFAAAVGVLLLLDFQLRVAEDPLNSPEYLALKQQLKDDPQNETLQASFRHLDEQLREAYFNRRQFALWGTWLLLGSSVLCAGLGKWAATLHRRLPHPEPVAFQDDPEETAGRAGRWAVAAFGGLAIVMIVGLNAGFRGSLPADSRQLAALIAGEATVDQPDPVRPSPPTPDVPEATPTVAESPPAAPDVEPDRPTAKTPANEPGAADLPELPGGFPNDDELRANWPRFRGWDGLGVVAAGDVPTAWDVESGEGILWKTEVPLPGNSSPVLWGDRIFLTGADEQTREVFCFDAASGELLWRQALPGTPESTAAVPKVMEATGFAAPTAVTDGRRVYAMFANGDLGAFDFDGRLRWSRSLGIPKNAYGHAASLGMHQDLLIVQFDQGVRDDGLSKLLALRGATGETVWETAREVPNSWPSPIVIQVGDRPQIITCADPWVIAYSPTDGSEIWRADCLKGDVGPSPVFAGGMVFAANEFPGVTAIRADGSGDVSDTHIAWEADLGVPDCASPLATEDHVYLLASYGILTCYDAREGGDPLWEQEFDAMFVSSPTLVGKLLYLFDEHGKVFIVEPTAEECRIVAENSLGEECVTSPVVINGRMIIRGKEHLICIGKQP